MSPILLLQTRHVRRFLAALNEDNATGPDGVATRLLKACPVQLALPFTKLCQRIVQTDCWSTIWKLHWILPLHRNTSVDNASNYRGIHLTSRMSRAAVQFIGALMLPYLELTDTLGPHHFAYFRGKGARDALALYVLFWILALAQKKVVVHSSVHQARAVRRAGESGTGHASAQTPSTSPSSCNSVLRLLCFKGRPLTNILYPTWFFKEQLGAHVFGMCTLVTRRPRPS